MKIIAFITDWSELQKIITNLKLPNFHPPPKIKAPTTDLDQDIYPDDFSFAA
jgi:hypothetical protein